MGRLRHVRTIGEGLDPGPDVRPTEGRAGQAGCERTFTDALSGGTAEDLLGAIEVVGAAMNDLDLTGRS